MTLDTTLENLWPPDFGTSDVVPPIVILRQQAMMLGQLTQNILQGEIQSNPFGSGHVNHTFYIKAPALDNYRYALFDASHDVDTLYPIKIDSNPKRGLQNEAELREALREIFAADRTKRVIRSLLAQSEVGFNR